MAKAVIISGLLTNFSDNFIKFIEDLDEEVHTYVSTWNTSENLRWVNKLMRHQYKTRITINMEVPMYEEKKYLLLHSTYQAANLIYDLNDYSTIIKFKPDLETDRIKYDKNVEQYFTEAAVHAYPLLNGRKKEEFVYGRYLYKTLDERMFTAYPEGIEKLFKRSYTDFFDDIYALDSYLKKKYTENYEGSILWTNYIKERKLGIIQDLTLKLPNCKN
jgi:hypothetical protein